MRGVTNVVTKTLLSASTITIFSVSREKEMMPEYHC